MPRCLCSQCARPLEFPEELSGQETTCPYCKKSTRLSVDTSPLVRLPANLPNSPFLKKVGGAPAPPESQPQSTPPPRRTSVRNPEAPVNDAPQVPPSRPATAAAGNPPGRAEGAAPDAGVAPLARRLLDHMERVIIGKRDRLTLALVAWFAEGHILLEDVPGVAKTMLARALAQSVGGTFKRVQCTPDLLPTDITGATIFNPRTTEFEFRPGPLFAQLVLADELNRATPRTQSALLEAMAERIVTVDGTPYPMDRPFLIIATQNPIDHEGTFPLPEAQLDRFLVRFQIGYPAVSDELRILEGFQLGHPIETLTPVATPGEILEAQERVRQIDLDPKVRSYLLRLVTTTREHPSVVLGASPRASLALLRASQSLAAIQGYDFVLPDHIKEVAPHVLGHRILIHPEKRLRKVSASMVIQEILHQTPVPTLPGITA
ncbi:MAG: AAA family ATPase [Verrucomicrobiota bacterium]